jgi:hypothetical protein
LLQKPSKIAVSNFIQTPSDNESILPGVLPGQAATLGLTFPLTLLGRAAEAIE